LNANFSFNGRSSKTGFELWVYKKYRNFETKIVLKEKTENYEKDPSWSWCKAVLFTVLVFAIMYCLIGRITEYTPTGYFLLDYFFILLQAFASLVFVGVFLIFLLFRSLNSRVMLQWHGCEHKTVNLIRQDLPLTEENLKKASRLNAYCGTTYLTLFWITSSVLVFFPFFERLFGAYVFLVLLFFFVIMFPLNLFLSCVVQYLFTTREPDAEQIQEALRLANRFVVRINTTESY